MKQIKLTFLVVLTLVMVSSCSNDTAETLTKLKTSKTTLSVSRADRVQAFAHNVVYDFLMKIDFNEDLINANSKTQLTRDIKKHAKDGEINRETFAAVLNKNLGIPPTSTNSMFSFVELNREMIATIERKEFELAMRHEFELLEKNPPRKATGLIAGLMSELGWGNNPCIGKRIGYTLDVLIDAAGVVSSGGVNVIADAGLAYDLYKCVDAYGPCDD